MCKWNGSYLSKFFAATAVSGGLLLAALAPSANAQSPSGCARGGFGGTIVVTPHVAHPGDLITITTLGVSLGPTTCTVTNGQSFLVYPNGSNNVVAGPPTGNGLNGAQMYETNFAITNLGTGASYDCLNSPPAAGGCLPVTLTYTVNSADVNRSLSFTSPRGFGSAGVSGDPGYIKFLVYSDGRVSPALTASGGGNEAVLIVNPCIAVTKNCTLPQGSSCFPAGQPVTFAGIVTNCGDTTLFGVAVNDTQATNIAFDATTSSGRAYDGTLTNGETIGYSGSYTPTGNVACTSVTNTVTATAQDITGLGVTNTATAVCPICCPPDICVFKGITCAPPTFTPDGPLTPALPPGGIAGCGPALSYGPEATGVAGPTNQTAFCYQIIVSNCGPDILTNVTVIDNLLTNVAGTFPTTLQPGQSVTNYYGDSFGLHNGGPSTNVNTVTATGTGAASGITTNATASATAVVLPISVSCQITLHSDFDQDANNGGADGSTDDNHVTLPAGSTNTPINFSEVITNPSPVGLVVTVTGLPPLVDCADTNTPITVNPIFIAAGGSATITGCIIESCPGGSITVSVQGTAVATETVECVYDANGNAVATASNTCSASVSCVQPVTCRVTGGGILEPNTSDTSCITVNTTIIPMMVNGLPVDKITHGGELGAPFSQMDCGAVLGNPCIRGQWEHVRHYVGKGNPRDVIDMNFHSATPKGVFDSLSCACLGCCDPTTGAFIPPTVGPLIHKFALCNPDDHSVCGPEPRPAPANAIIFSGVGTLTPTTDNGANNKAATWVVFRVYIEDRSEPGGFHPKGATEPADIYVFQAWNTGILVSKKPNFNGIQTQFRKDLGQANCDFLDALSSGTSPIGTLPSPTVDGITADIQDMGPLYSGNHQIHPATDATCTQ